MGIKVKVKNTTKTAVKIQEGNAGVFLTRRVLKSEEEYTLDLDANATYREYVLITLPNNTAIQQMFSSDDVTEFKEIVIRETVIQDGKKQYYWEGILRGDKSECTKSADQSKLKEVPREDSNTSAAEPRMSWFQKIRKLF